MRILADENMPDVEALFGDVASSITRLPGRQLTRERVAAADVLLVRSITPVDAQLVGEHSLSFVGSATIGVDHIDQPWLATRGIPFAHAPGCNAQGVVDYVLGALLALYSSSPDTLASRRVAVVGAGNVGGRLVTQLRALGLDVVVCDPPRAASEPNSSEPAFVDLETAFEADIVCCHTPLTRTGQWPTRHMITTDLLTRMPKHAVLLNAGRGEIVASEVLRQVLDRRPDLNLVLDVWEPEPNIPLDLLARARIATGHIAGYSMEGRVRGTWMLRQALSAALGVPKPAKTLSDLLPPAPALTLSIEAATADAWQIFSQCVLEVCDPLGDDRRFREALETVPVQQVGAAFDAYRKHYATRDDQRRELASTVLTYEKLSAPLLHLLNAAGFRLVQKGAEC